MEYKDIKNLEFGLNKRTVGKNKVHNNSKILKKEYPSNANAQCGFYYRIVLSKKMKMFPESNKESRQKIDKKPNFDASFLTFEK